MRDRYSHEVARTLWQYGFYKKHQDAGYRNRMTKEMAKQEDPGLADGYFMGITGGPVRAFVETKTGGDRFEFDRWTEKQRLFAVACEFSMIPYWLFLFMGDRIGGRRHPRVAFLVTAEDMAETIWAAGDRKSLSYETALTRFSCLNWLGNSTWEIPEGHPFNGRSQRDRETSRDSLRRLEAPRAYSKGIPSPKDYVDANGRWVIATDPGFDPRAGDSPDFVFFKPDQQGDP